MIDPEHFRMDVVRPTLRELEPFIPYSEAAEEILMGTAVQESRLTYLHQIGGGPARGVYQIEPNTHRDIYENFLRFNQPFQATVRQLAGTHAAVTDQGMNEQLATNLAYATAIARIQYFRAPEALPDPEDVEGMATLWKLRFNTPLGRGEPAEFVQNYQKHILNL